MKKEYLQSSAMFMICLVVALPIYASSVSAGLSNSKVYGTDGIENYVRNGDTVTIEVDNRITGDDEISGEQTRLGGNGVCDAGIPFDECMDDDGDGTWRCAIEFETDLNQLDYPIHKFKLFSFDDSCTSLDVERAEVYFDDKAPILDLRVSDIRAHDEINWITEITERDALGPGSCTGIDKIEFYLNEPDDLYQTVQVNTEDCITTIETEHDANDFTDGDYVLFARVLDEFENPSNVDEAYFSIDTISPDIDSSSLRIFDSNDIDVEFIGRDPVPVTVEIKVEETPDLEDSSIIADLSEFNPNEDYSRLPGSCGRERGGYTTCQWWIDIELDESMLYNVRINASDTTGNVNDFTYQYRLDYDTEGPTVNSLVTDRIDSTGLSYARAYGNRFTASFSDNGPGVVESTAFLDLTSIGLDVISADNCTMSFCYWNDVAVPGADGMNEISISTDTTDSLGNHLLEEFAVDIMVDKTPPIFDKFAMEIGGGTSAVYQGYVKTGDFLSISMNVTETSHVVALADFSEMITGANSVEGTCEEFGNKWQCSWDTDTITTSGDISLRFYVTDFAGNNYTYIRDLTVYGENIGNVDYWSSSVDCSPSVLDRSIATMVNQRTYCRVALTPKSGNPSTIAINLATCTGDHVQDGSISNNYEGSTEPFIKLTMDKQELTVDSIDVNCVLTIISLADNQVTTIPEQESIDITLGLHSMPLGEIGAGVEKKIDDAHEAANGGMWQLVGTLNTLIQYAQVLCRLINAWYSVSGTWTMLKYVIGKAKDATLVPGVRAALKSQEMANCFGVTVLKEDTADTAKKKFGDILCNFVNCKTSAGGKWTGWLKDWQTFGDDLMGDLGGDKAYELSGKTYKQYMNPRKSIGVALLTGCIPGILYGLNKYRQILCMYADCLEANAETGMPLKVCEDQKQFATCKYVFGEFAALFPLSALFDYYTGIIKNMLSDPFSVLGAALAYSCKQLCAAEPAEAHWGCASVKVLSLIGSTLKDVQSIFDGSYWQINKDYCDGGGGLFGSSKSENKK